MPNLPALEELFAHPMGRAAAITGLLYAHQRLGTKVGLLLVLLYVRYANNAGMWEHMTMPHTNQCTCKGTQKYDPDTKQCKGSDGLISEPVSCDCPAGYEYKNGGCEEKVQIPVPPPSHMPMTTPGEAQALAQSTVAPPSGGPGPVPMDRATPTMASV